MRRTAGRITAIAALALGGCSTTVGGLPGQWRGDGPPVVTAPPGGCPPLDGAYASVGLAHGDEARPTALQSALGHDLGLTGLLALNAEPAATVVIARAADGDVWRLSDAHGAVRLTADRTRVPLDPNWTAHGSRIAGCAGGRLWIGLSAVRTRLETMTETRALGVLSIDSDGALVVETRTERRHHALLPWPSVQRRATRYAFPAITEPLSAPASPAAERPPPPSPSA